MSDVPTTEEVRDSYRYSNQRPDICGKDFGIEFDRWLAKHDAEVAARAWSEGWSARASRGYAHLKVGECVPPPAHINPYREAVQS